LHVRDALRVTPKENLEMIADSVAYLKQQGREVIYDAEHFFDGYKSNPQYALKTLEAASEAGADIIALCDTNGGTMPHELAEIIKKVKQTISTPLGIHVHNDSGVAVANSIIAVEHGAVQVQGTINGFGERCGNADLSVIIPNLMLKYGISCIPKENLKLLTEVSRFVAETANMNPFDKQPYVGYSAFAHKAGIHVSAIQRNPETYEHIKPESVGNTRRVLVSDQAGKSNVFFKAAELGIELDKSTPEAKEILNRIKELEHLGYEFEAADGTFELLVKKAVGKHRSFFQLEGFRVIVEKRNNKLFSEATIKVRVDDKFEHTAAEGDGPVNALDNALRKALVKFYPQLRKVRLADYKVRVLDAKSGTGAKVRVLIESTDGKNEWGTVGISENILEASWQALVDSIEYRLLKDEEIKERKNGRKR